MHWGVNNQYGWALSQALLADGFKLKNKKSRFTHNFIQNYDDDSDKRYISEVDVSYLEHLQKIYGGLLFLSQRMKIK